MTQVCALNPHGLSTTAPAVGLVEAVESIATTGASVLLILIEEPELYLRPQAQRYLYRLLRAIAAAGNQVVYSTHAPTFLNVGSLEEIVFVRHADGAGIRVRRPKPLALDGDFRLLAEFGAERSELFLARAALLVEGATEKMVFPFVFRALGHDADREAITIVECGGKSNIPLFAQVCRAAGIPFVAVHDRDAVAGRHPIASERAVNGRIAEVVRRTGSWSSPPISIASRASPRAGTNRSEPGSASPATASGFRHSSSTPRAWRSRSHATSSRTPWTNARAGRVIGERPGDGWVIEPPRLGEGTDANRDQARHAGIRMNAGDSAKTLLVLVVVLSVAATLGAGVASVAPTPHRDVVNPRAAHVLTPPPRTGLRGQSRPAHRPDDSGVDVTAYVNLYAVAGALTCVGLLAYWGWWQTRHRCPSCGACPAWCRCGEVTHHHDR